MCICGGVIEVTVIGMVIAWLLRPFKKKHKYEPVDKESDE